MTNDFEYFKTCFPHIAKKTDSFVDVGHGEFVATCYDGTKALFNIHNKSYRYLPEDPDELTKYECMAEFGHRFVRMLERKRVTQRELSERTGIQRYLISDYANGIRLPGFYNMDKIAKALDCSVDEFRYIE